MTCPTSAVVQSFVVTLISDSEGDELVVGMRIREVGHAHTGYMLKQNKHRAHFVPDVRCESNTVIITTQFVARLTSWQASSTCKWLITVLACRQQAAVMSST